MRSIRCIVLLTALATVTSTLTACTNFDPDKLDVFGLNEKKKLPGERREVFPGGVPGVTQGIPPEYVKGSQPPADAAEAAAGDQGKEKTAAVEAEPAPKPKPKRTAKPRTASQPAQVTVQPQQQQAAPWPQQNQQPPQQQSQAPWPGQGQTSTAAPWPSSPSPGTFSR